MKTIALILALTIGMFSTYAADTTSTSDKQVARRYQAVKQAIRKEVNKHIFYPTSREETTVGTADVVLQLTEKGTLKIYSIETNNDAVKNFIIQQVAKMKVPKENVLAGEMFKYRFVFKRQA